MSDKPPTKLELVNAISDDPFDLDKLRVSPDFLETTNVRKLLTTVPIKKPNQQDFIRVHPSPAYRDLFAFIELKDDREIYIADLSEVPDLQTECFVATLFTVDQPFRLCCSCGRCGSQPLRGEAMIGTCRRQPRRNRPCRIGSALSRT